MVLLRFSILYFNILLVIVASLASCNSNSKKIKPDDKTVTSISEVENITIDTLTQPDLSDIEVPGTNRNDSIYISGNYILFYGPSEKDIDKIINSNNTSSGLEESILEFHQTIQPIIDSLMELNGSIKSSFTTERTICISMDLGNKLYFNRNSLKYPFGLIIMDGAQLPIIQSGNISSERILTIIKRFFVNDQIS